MKLVVESSRFLYLFSLLFFLCGQCLEGALVVNFNKKVYPSFKLLDTNKDLSNPIYGDIINDGKTIRFSGLVPGEYHLIEKDLMASAGITAHYAIEYHGGEQIVDISLPFQKVIINLEFDNVELPLLGEKYSKPIFVKIKRALNNEIDELFQLNLFFDEVSPGIYVSSTSALEEGYVYVFEIRGSHEEVFMTTVRLNGKDIKSGKIALKFTKN